MSRTLIIFYELAEPGQNGEQLTQKIKSFGTWARLGNSAYLIVTNKAPKLVRDELSTDLGAADRVFVGVAPRPSAWKGLPEAVSKWIIANQGS